MLSFKTPGFAGYSVAYSPFYDSKLAVAGSANFGLAGNGRLNVLDIGNDGIIRAQGVFDTQDSQFALAWSEAHANHVIVACGDGSLRLFDIAASQPFPLTVFKEHTKEVFGVDWNMVDKNLVCSAAWDGQVKIWNPAQSQNSILTLHVPISGPSGNHNGAGASSTGHIKTSRDTQPSASGPMIPRAHVYCAKFSPHAPTSLISTSTDVCMWDTRAGAGAPAHVIPNVHFGDILGMDWNKYRSTVFATCGVDKAIKIWDSRQLTSPVNDLRGHEFAVRSVKWSPHNGHTLLSTSYDMTCRVWDDDSTQMQRFNPRVNPNKGLKRVFNAHTEFVIDCDWSLWGEPGWVATTGWDDAVFIWKA